MNILNATMSAETLKRVIGVLAKVGDQAVFMIERDGLMCQVVEGAEAQQTKITIPKDAYACDHYDAVPAKVGVDIEWMMEILECTMDDAIINMSIDETEMKLDIGMHGVSQKLIDLNEIRNPVEDIKLKTAATMELSGRFFKDMVKYIEVIEAHALEIYASRTNVSFRSWHEFGDSRKYDVEVDCLKMYLDDARGLYSIDYLDGIADCIQPNDMIFVGIGTDRPIEIRYVVDGCEIQHILAPRIEV